MNNKKPGPAKGYKISDIVRSPFGERLFKARRLRGLSQTELGKKAGLSKRAVAFYEGDNEKGPNVEILLKLSEALEVTVSYLVGQSPVKMDKEEIKPSLRKIAEKIELLSPKDKRAVIRMVDGLLLQNEMDNKK